MLAENKLEWIKSEPNIAAVINLSQSFIGFPDTMSMTWEQLSVDTQL